MKAKIITSITGLLISLLAPLAVLVPRAAAVTDTCTWIGGTDTNFSTAANWSCSLDGTAAPEAGDTLQFTQLATTTSTTSLINDISSTEFGGIIVDVTENTADVTETYSIGGITLADGATITKIGTSSDTGTKINANFTVSGDFTVNSDIVSVLDWWYSYWTVNNGTFTIQDNITSSISLRGDFKDVVIGDNVSEVTIYGNNIGFSLDSLTVGTASVTFEMQYQDTTPEITFPITVDTSTLKFNKSQWYETTWKSADTSFTVSGNITLNGNVNMWPNNGVDVNITGTITKNSNVMRYDPYALGTVKVNGEELVPDPVTIADNDKTTDSLAISKNEVIVLNGERGSAYVYDGGTLKGKGTITGTVNVTDGGTLAPGESPGCLTMGGLIITGNYDVELVGTTACTQYDQSVVNGTVDVTGATLNVSFLNDYEPADNAAFMIINNDGADAVTGTFAGLDDGSTFTVDGYTLQINYNGGDGNDVMLLVTEVPAAPDTGIESLVRNPMITLSAALAVLGVLGVQRFATKRS